MAGSSAWGRRLPRPRPTDADGRRAAFAILQAVDAGRGHSNALLAALPDGMDERDRALATELVYGVLRRRAQLDRALLRWSRRPLERIDPALRTVLRMGLYQILRLTRVPVAAAVNESVKLARRAGGRGAAAFANAVLRAAGREGAPSPPSRPPPDSGPEAQIAWLEETHSCPRFLIARFFARYGAEGCEALLEVIDRPAPITLRVTRRSGGAPALAARLRDEGIDTRPSPLLPEALRVRSGAPQRSLAFRDGSCYIQDEASQLVARLAVPLDRSAAYLDLCSAPGGKLLAVAEGANAPAGPIIAADLSLDRLRTLGDNARRLGFGGLFRVAMDATRPALRGRFGTILLDAPCSGTGILRRHPEIRWRRAERDIVRFAALQARALRLAVDQLEPGGRLVYAVCSLEPEEGPDQIAALLRACPWIAIADAHPLLPAQAATLVGPDGCLRTLPHRDDLDGFYAAVLQRAPSC
jgi:16S rRNA (cytosine967-C5)-methyltransferase